METINSKAYISSSVTFNGIGKNLSKWISEQIVTGGPLENQHTTHQHDDSSKTEDLADLASILDELERSLDIVLGYTTSNNPHIPIKHCVNFISNLRKVKEELSSFPQIDNGTVRAMWEVSRPFLTIEQLYKEDEATISAQSLDTLQDRAHEILQKNTSELNKAKHEIRKERQTALDQMSLNIESELGAIQSRIDDSVKKFSDKQELMDSYFEKLGVTKEGEVYLTQANRERKTSNILRGLGLFGMVLSIVLLGFLFKDYLGFGEELTKEYIENLKLLGTEIFALRFMSVLLITAPSIYLLKESAGHRTKENLYRQRGTQLVTISSYLDDLSSEDRSKLKVDLADNFFSFHNGKADTQNVPDFIRDMKEAVGIAKSLNGQTKTVSQRFNRKSK
ncbi:hypothetical protein OAE_12175 [Vibrio cyclitrophicus 1F289]|nr:hypothetical protein OAE_12175 [Vibrio cyclitrophicus 1F289]